MNSIFDQIKDKVRVAPLPPCPLFLTAIDRPMLVPETWKSWMSLLAVAKKKYFLTRADNLRVFKYPNISFFFGWGYWSQFHWPYIQTRNLLVFISVNFTAWLSQRVSSHFLLHNGTVLGFCVNLNHRWTAQAKRKLFNVSHSWASSTEPRHCQKYLQERKKGQKEGAAKVGQK